MTIILFTILALIISAIFHEYAHGWVAYKLGDNTAKDEGRLTLNPLAHIDLYGSIIIPLLLVISKVGFIVGWAKPVPFNPYNLRDQKYGNLKVALGGPATNFILALIFGLLARFSPLSIALKQNLIINFLSQNTDGLLSQMQGSFLTSLFVLSIIICIVNLVLMVFNLIPLPPLDGSKILMTFLPHNWQISMQRIEPFSLIILLLLIFLGLLNFIWPIILFIFGLILGL